MRQKRVHAATKDRMQAGGVIIDLTKIVLPKTKISLEIGSGKGQFITALAKDHPSETFIALERNINVCYRILEKKEAHDLSNLIIILGDADHITGFFEPNMIDQIYLNFSDPWPKARHHKRRLTSPTYLEFYQRLLKPGGKLQFRTDHASFFHDAIEDIETYFLIESIDRDLKPSAYMTEYEEKKRATSLIYQLKARIIHDQPHL